MLIDEIKKRLRIANNAFDGEIQDLMDAARADIVRGGVLRVKADDDSDPLVRQLITWYCKAYFGFDNPDADRNKICYESLKMDLLLTAGYTQP